MTQQTNAKKSASNSKASSAPEISNLAHWPAMTPMGALAASTAFSGLEAGQAYLHACRLQIDAWRDMVRTQQDAMFAMMRAQVSEASQAAAQLDEAADAPAEPFVAPIAAATRAYGQFSNAFIQAQRNTLDSIAAYATIN